jgi:hypothetical protein
LNFSGFAFENAARGLKRARGGSSSGVREEWRRVNRVCDVSVSFEIALLNNWMKGVMPVPPDI